MLVTIERVPPHPWVLRLNKSLGSAKPKALRSARERSAKTPPPGRSAPFVPFIGGLFVLCDPFWAIISFGPLSLMSLTTISRFLRDPLWAIASSKRPL